MAGAGRVGPPGKADASAALTAMGIRPPPRSQTTSRRRCAMSGTPPTSIRSTRYQNQVSHRKLIRQHVRAEVQHDQRQHDPLLWLFAAIGIRKGQPFAPDARRWRGLARALGVRSRDARRGGELVRRRQARSRSIAISDRPLRIDYLPVMRDVREGVQPGSTKNCVSLNPGWPIRRDVRALVTQALAPVTAGTARSASHRPNIRPHQKTPVRDRPHRPRRPRPLPIPSLAMA
jgi:hypothetical protein